MTKTSQLSLYNKLYLFIKALYQVVRNMPKEYKYCIGNEVLSISWRCLDLFLEANSLPNHEKRRVIAALSCEFDKMKTRLRMMQEIKILTIGQFVHFQDNYIQPIGMIIGGWLKWSNAKKATISPSATI